VEQFHAVSNVKRIVADRGDAGRRVDLVLHRHLGDIRASRARVQRWLADGLVSINGTPVRRSATRAKSGDVVCVALPHGVAVPATPPEEAAVDVLYEDAHLLVVNKPAGVVVHPAYRNRTGTLLNALCWRARLWPEGQRPSLVGRLDKLTSGALVVAKTAAVHRELQDPAIMVKEYLAVVYGRPRAHGTLAGRLASDPDDRRRIAVTTAGGRASVTRFERLGRVAVPPAGLALLRCELATGRRHQLRVHLSANGWPIVGDPVYGAPRWAEINDVSLSRILKSFPRQALHSWRVTLTHPVLHTQVTVVAPVPADIDRLLAAAGLSAPSGA